MSANFFYIANSGDGNIVKVSRTDYSLEIIVSYGETRAPQGVAYDSVSGNIYIADTLHGDIKEYSSNGVVSSNIDAKVSYPSGISTDKYGGIYFGESSSLRAAFPCIWNCTSSSVVTSCPSTSTFLSHVTCLTGHACSNYGYHGAAGMCTGAKGYTAVLYEESA